MPKPIKFPTGPSAAGASASRALSTAGGDWQRRNGAGFVARIAGDFSRVESVGFEYLTQGRLRPTPAATAQFAAFKYQAPFLPGFGKPLQLNVGGGRYFGFPTTAAAGSTSTTHTYTVYPGHEIVANAVTIVRGAEAHFGGFYGGYDFRTTIMFSQTQTMAGGQARLSAPHGALLGTGDAGRVVATLVPSANGRTDAAGRVLEDPALVLIREKGAASVSVLTTPAFTRPEAEFFPFMPGIATQDHAVFFVLEKFFRTEPATSSVGKQPQFWAIRMRDKSASSLSALNVSTLFAGAHVPDPNPGSYPDMISYYGPYEGVFENVRNGDSMSFMKVLAMPGNSVLITYFVFCAGSTPDEIGVVTGRDFRLRIARVNIGDPASAAIVFEKTVSFTLGPTAERRYPKQFIQDIVHLGGGKVLARAVHGIGSPRIYAGMPEDEIHAGGGWDVSFLRSLDGGTSWAEFSPTGFDAPLKNGFFGNFTVHAPAGAVGDGVVLCTSWDPGSSAYAVYRSKDAGLTWVRQGRISKTSQFQRIDSVFDADGGGNFAHLLPGPDPARPVDITIPSRFAGPL